MDYVLISSENYEDFSSVLPRDVFGGQQSIAIGAYDGGGLVCGAISVTQTEENYLVDWLYVEPPMRRRYIGSDLVREVTTFIEQTGIMPIVCQFPVPEGESDGELSPGEQVLAFFESIGDEKIPVDVTLSHTRFITEAKDFYTSGDLRRSGAVSSKTPLRFFNQSEIYKRKAMALIDDHMSILDKEQFEKTCIPELCLTIENGGSPTALMLTQKRGNYVVLSYLYGKNPKELYSILCEAAEEVRVNYPDSKVVLDIVSPSAMALSERFFSKAERYKMYEAEW